MFVTVGVEEKIILKSVMYLWIYSDKTTMDLPPATSAVLLIVKSIW
jgi:hypothetical protein